MCPRPLTHHCLGTRCKSAGAALCWGPLPPTPCCLLTCTNCLQVPPRYAGDGYLLYHSLQWSPSMPAPPYGWINFSSAARSSTDCYSRVNDRLCSQFCLLYICLLPTVMPAGSCTSLPPAARGFADPAMTLSASSSADGGSPPVGAILCRRRCSSLSPSHLFPTRYVVCHKFRRCIMTALFSPSSSPSFSHMKTEPPLPLLLVSS